ncbi:MAG: AAA family ATPase [Proteobacteria bacterium]|nr:AAA family ATPase [Pseudomonadota bacterium]
MYLKRLLNIDFQSLDRSLFIMGPRQTGKSSFLRHQGPNQAVSFNLLDTKLRQQLEKSPWILREQVLALQPLPQFVVIDEIQLIPELLNEVHLLIEETGIRFVLTGSSARKLRRTGTNLLGGRADEYHFHPFSAMEVGIAAFDLLKALRYGLLPSVYVAKSPKRVLQAYASQYLEQEIRLEGLVRSLPAFSRFLEVAALRSGTQLNYESIAKDSGVPRTTVHEYFTILYDTFLAFPVEPWTRSTKRKPVKSNKMYFFDVGVARYLAGLPLVEFKSKDIGDAMEHWIMHEIKTWIDANALDIDLHYWRTTTGVEVDFIVDNSVAIEVKAKGEIRSDDCKGLLAISEEGIDHLYVVCLEEKARKHGKVLILPWQDFLKRLWAGEIIKVQG